MAWCLALASLIEYRSSLIVGKLAVRHSATRQLDGLRGILAISVFVHHGVSTYFLHREGHWSVPSDFYALFGSAPVVMFFFLTGYLFWSKLMRQRGPLGKKEYFQARFYRLAPAYYFSLALILLVVAVESRFTLHVGVRALAAQIARWAAFGLPAGTFPTLNALPDSGLINAYVVWSLRYEWLFYFLVPFIGWFALKNRVFLLILMIWLSGAAVRLISFDHLAELTGVRLFSTLGQVIGFFSVFFLNAFVYGILAAYLQFRFKLARYLQGPAGAALALAAIGVLPFIDYGAYSPWEGLILFFAFLPIVYGQTFFGFLTWRPVLHLGAISYSVYLVHGIVLHVFFALLGPHMDWKGISGATYWLWVALAAAGVLVVANGMYRLLEWPYLSRAKPVRPPAP